MMSGDGRCADGAAGCGVDAGAGARCVSASMRPSAAAALSIEHLSFAYDREGLAGNAASCVLRDVSLELPAGAFALLVGDTGSGKSTLLSLVKPEIAPHGVRTGDIRVSGVPVEELDGPTSARTIGFVFQRPDNQIVCDTVWHEMAFGLESLGVPQGEMRRLVAETSYFFGLEPWFRQQTDELSGGRKQLLALASTLVMKPSLLLLDEPTAQLDPIAEKNFLHALFRVNRELGCTVLVATHSPRAMVDYATCAFELVDGAVRPIADMDALRGLPVLLDEPAEEASLPAGQGAGVSSPAEHGGAGRTSAAQSGTVWPSAARDAAAPTLTGQEPLVQLANVWHRYGRDDPWVIRGLDLKVQRGSVHTLVGGNGCGKSTLLSLVAGMARPARGRVRTNAAVKALLPQDPRALLVAETAMDELMEWHVAGAYTADDAREMLGRLGLSLHAARHPYDLSGGQQQLLALGKLLLLRPELLLLDEPTKGLDLASRRMLARTLRHLRAQGAAVLMATHDLDFVQQAADTVSMMFDGELACTESAAAFFEGNVYYRP